MKSIIHTHQLGPWNMSEEIPFGSKQYFKMNHVNKQASVPPKLTLPKLDKTLSCGKQIQVKLKQVKQKNQEQLKMNSIQIQLENQLRMHSNGTQLLEARKSRTLSFNPPMISFYNKKHPKIKKIKQRNSIKFTNFYLQKGEQKQQQKIANTNTVSKITLLNQPNEKKDVKILTKQEQKHEALNNRSSFRKLINLLRISDTSQIWTQRANSYFNKQKLNGINRYIKLNSNSNSMSTGSVNQQVFHPYRQAEKMHYFKRQKSFQASPNLNRSK